MVSALDFGSGSPGSSPGWGHCVVFWGKTLYSGSGGPFLARLWSKQNRETCLRFWTRSMNAILLESRRSRWNMVTRPPTLSVITSYLKIYWEPCCNLLLNRPTNHDRLTPLESYCLTDQSVTQTGLGTFERQQLLTRLWWWLPLRLSKPQPLLPTTVLHRSTLTWTITLHYRKK